MELLMSVSVVGLFVVAFIALVRSLTKGPAEKSTIEFALEAVQVMKLISAAAADAVLMVEGTLKENQDKTDEELQEAAIHYAMDILKGVGVVLDDAVVRALIVAVEAAYQRLKRAIQLDDEVWGQPFVGDYEED